ncbi:30S ribosomal protein S1 protein [Trifolium repens]|nr:30S ribosomal protein S1 protein [Trifolium repens]
MGSFPITTKTLFFTTTTHLPWFSSSNRRTTRTVYLNKRKNNKVVFASSSSSSQHNQQDKNTPQFDNDDIMELKLGRYLGEDPKLTLAKIMGRKANPDVSYLDIEKSFYNKKKGKVVEIEELPFEVERPWAKKNSPPQGQGLQFKSDDDDNDVAMEIKKPNQIQSKGRNVRKSSVPNVILRKPSSLNNEEDKDEVEDVSSRLRIKPNFSLKMQSGQVKDKFSDMTLLRKPGSSIAKNIDSQLKTRKEEPSYVVSNLTLLEQPHRPSCNKELEKSTKQELEKFAKASDEVSNLTLLEQPHRPSSNKELEKFAEPSDEVAKATLLEQPHRPSSKKEEEQFEEASDEVAKATLLEQPQRPSGKKEEGKFEEPSDEVPKVTLLEQPHRPSGKKEEEQFEEPGDEVSEVTLLEQPHRPSSNKELEKSAESSDEVPKVTLLEQPHRPSSKKEKDQFQEPSDEVAKATLLEQPHRPSGKKEEEQFEEPSDEVSKVTLLEQPHRPSGEKEEEQFGDVSIVVQNDGLEKREQRQPEVHQEPIDLNQPSDLNLVGSKTELSVQAVIQGKPKRLDQYVKQTSKAVGEATASLYPGSRGNSDESGNLVDVSDVQEGEDADWTKVEDLFKTGDRGDVELVSCSTQGFDVSFGTLEGFLPYRNLFSKWKFFAFESWLRQRGLDPSMYRQNLVTTTNYDADSPSLKENDGNLEDKISPDMKLEDLLRIYDQEKNKFLSSFIGQKIKAYVFYADRKSKKLIFSLRPKENEELTEKRRNLMARLQVGDIVKCRIQKITYFGIFVEVEGVSALIHQSQISWDATFDPSNYFKIDQIVEAKVHQLNPLRGRIFLSLKEVTPDPLMESLESVVGDRETFDGRLEAAENDAEWSEVESLIKELQKIEGVQSVSKGRFFRSPGLAPTFQVYMASIFENQYKLLARSGNKVQEVMVQTSLDKETMKTTIMTCANRVE